MRSRTKQQWLGIFGLLVLLFGCGVLRLESPSLAQQPKGEDGKTKRAVYVVKYGSAKSLAAALGKFFKGDVEIQVVSDGAADVLLLSARGDTFDDVVATLAKLDRRPQVVALDIFVIEVLAKKAADGKAQPGDRDLDEKDLSGPADKVADNVAALQKKGVLGSVRRFTVTGVEHQITTMLNGETKPYITGLTTAANGQVRTSISYKNVGTNIQLVPRAAGDKDVMLELRLDDSRMVQPDDGVSLGIDDKGRPVMASEHLSAILKANVTVPSGQAVLVQGVQITSKAGNARMLVVVSARLVP